MDQNDIVGHGNTAEDKNSAADIIRQKIEALYSNEPSAQEEIKGILSANLAAKSQQAKPRSKHQQFMYELSVSGKPLAEIQTAWHNYYLALPDKEKHEVWQEFYQAHGHKLPNAEAQATPKANQATGVGLPKRRQGRRKPGSLAAPYVSSLGEIKNQLIERVNSRTKLSSKHNIRSAVFGLSMGSLVLLVLLFGFFNERFVAPFITPSRNVSSTPIIVDPNNVVAGPETKVIIPKINVEIPVVYEAGSIEEKVIQNALEKGVAHYPTTPKPGEQGNSVIFGHSSNNIFNPGKYKFAFVLLSRLEAGDTFILTRDGKRFVYRVYDKRVIPPDDVSVLGPADKAVVASLITCDPPGTSINRLVVRGEQIAPDPATNVASTAIQTDRQPELVPSNAPSLWQRIRELFSRS